MKHSLTHTGAKTHSNLFGNWCSHTCTHTHFNVFIHMHLCSPTEVHLNHICDDLTPCATNGSTVQGFFFRPLLLSLILDVPIFSGSLTLKSWSPSEISGGNVWYLIVPEPNPRRWLWQWAWSVKCGKRGSSLSPCPHTHSLILTGGVQLPISLPGTGVSRLTRLLLPQNRQHQQSAIHHLHPVLWMSHHAELWWGHQSYSLPMGHGQMAV